MIPRYTRPDMAAIWSDENKFSIWLRIEILACERMCAMGQIPPRDMAAIRRRAGFDVDRIHAIEAKVNHDVIAFLTNVAERIGRASRHMHRGLTSSDLLDTTLAVQMVQAADLLIRGARNVRAAAARKARRYKFTPMMGRSHGVHAEPITFGLKMALMFDEFTRAVERLERAREVVRVGKLSGAVGTHAHIDPSVETYVCRHLGLRPDRLSTQIVQRDRHADYVAALALVATSIERWAQEFRHLQRTEVREVEEFFGREQKGSSAMPHKKNPILGERLCGMARLVRGYALAAMENVPLWHERDISHSSAERVLLPDATIALDYMLAKLADLVERLRVFPDAMERNLHLLRGLIHSQSVLLKLTDRGATREEAYRIVQRNAMKVWEQHRDFREVLSEDRELQAWLAPGDLDEVFDLRRHFRDVNRTFRRLGL